MERLGRRGLRGLDAPRGPCGAAGAAAVWSHSRRPRLPGLGAEVVLPRALHTGVHSTKRHGLRRFARQVSGDKRPPSCALHHVPLVSDYL